ncbi:FAD-dependent oxidoreductase [uncultured Jatrophihabitans sp.]|uniref:FAD-dependent oxidoreductase n=1 Tax=uncultured Jatrophihabitans sp. TaxID=1610747 RepID=UPI0035CC6325
MSGQVTSRPGRDRRAVRHAGAPGRLRDDVDRHVVVVGGGIAGLAAATALAERGVRVTVLEREPQLGGRVAAWPVQRDPGDTGDTVTMSRGFHAFFRQYYNLRSLLKRVDAHLRFLRPVGDYPLLSADGTRESFAGLPKAPPLNMAAFLLRSKAFRLREVADIDTVAARELIDVDFPATFAAHDAESAAQFLDRLRFPAGARHLALEVFARSFFADPEDFGAAELIAMFHGYFTGSSEGLLFDVPDDDYDSAIWAPLGRYLHRLGVDVHTGAPVESVESGADGVVVSADGGQTHADAVVLAADLRSTQHLLAPEPALRGADDKWRVRLAALRTAPPFAVWRLWFDGPAAANRSAFLGTAGFGLVDNISVLERFEAGAAAWVQRTGGSVVELHAYALPPDVDAADARARMLATLRSIYPEYARHEITGEEFLQREDCPLIDQAPWFDRPDVTTPDPRVVLAGDGVRCDYPVALMERAATTGLQAANRLLADWGLAGHDLWTVPLRGRHVIRRAGHRGT